MENAHLYQTALIAITREDGGVSIMCYIVCGRGNSLPIGATWLDQSTGWWVRPATDANINTEIDSLPHREHCVSWRRIEPNEVPPDRTYRDAWRDSSEGIIHDMCKAREVHRKRLRSRRYHHMKALDGQWMCAFGQGNKKMAEEIENQRQILRDMPADPRIDSAESIEQLSALMLPAV